MEQIPWWTVDETLFIVTRNIRDGIKALDVAYRQIDFARDLLTTLKGTKEEISQHKQEKIARLTEQSLRLTEELKQIIDKLEAHGGED